MVGEMDLTRGETEANSELPVIREELGSSRAEPAVTSAMPTSRDLLFDLKTAKGRHKALDLAGRRGFAEFQVALNTQSGEVGQHHFRNC
jgi:hypothetical protein